MKKVGIIFVTALTMLLTGCGDNTPNDSLSPSTSTAVSSNAGTSPSSTAAASSNAGAPSSSTSAASSVKDTSSSAGESVSSAALSSAETSEEPPVVQPEQLEKIPLTEDELKNYYMKKYYCLLENFSQRDAEHKLIDAEFDISELVYSGNPRTFEYIDFWCGGFGVAPDRKETTTVWYDDPSDTWEAPVYIYSAKTAEKIIRKFIPDFDINSVDYKKWYSWNDEKNAFSVTHGEPDGGWIYSLPYKLESGYKLGDEVYLNVSVDNRDQLNKRLSQVSRDELKEMRYRRLKQFRIKDNNLMSVKNIDEDPEEWRETALNIFDMIQNDDVLNLYVGPNSSKSVGVMDGNLGKRICFISKGYMGSHRFVQYTSVYTYGTRGKGDVITFSGSSGGAINYTAMTPQEMWNESYIDCTIEDKLKGEKYDYSYDKFEYPDDYTGKHFDEKPDTYKYNDKEISEDMYNSAELVKYFKHFQEFTLSDENLIYTCKNGTDPTVGEFYEMCRILYE